MASVWFHIPCIAIVLHHKPHRNPWSSIGSCSGSYVKSDQLATTETFPRQRGQTRSLQLGLPGLSYTVEDGWASFFPFKKPIDEHKTLRRPQTKDLANVGVSKISGGAYFRAYIIGLVL